MTMTWFRCWSVLFGRVELFGGFDASMGVGGGFVVMVQVRFIWCVVVWGVVGAVFAGVVAVF